MHSYLWRLEVTERDSFFNPKHNQIASAPLIVTKIVIKTQFGDRSGFQELDSFTWPIDTHPSVGRRALVVQKYSHFHLHTSF